MSDVVPQGRCGPSASDESETVVQLSGPSAYPNEGSATPVEATVSRYIVLEELGRGGMGCVLRAYDPKLQREVALKEVRRDRLDEETTARLVTEARAMAKLSHPNVVAVYDVEESRAPHEPPVVLVMEYVAGQTLRQWLREERRQAGTIITYFVAAGRGLAAAHDVGLLHRDFKPANVLVSSPSEREAGGTKAVVKVGDFGIAKLSTAAPHSSAFEDDRSSEELTQAGTVLGTPRYMAPEQHRGQPLTAAADQYAFCIALWEALCGAPPFSGRFMAEDKAAGPPAWPQSTTSRPIVEAMMRGLSPEAEDRWTSMEALLQALARDRAGRRSRVLLTMGALGLLGLGGVSYQTWVRARAQRCSGARLQLVGVWDDDRRAQMRSAFYAVGKAYAVEAWIRTEQALDTYAGDWAAMHTDACEATTVRGEQAPQMLDLRMACLHRAAVELGATVEVLAGADEETVQRAHELTGSLRSLTRCADTDALAAEVEPPEFAEADAVEQARAHLAEAKSLSAAGQYQQGRRALEEAQTMLEGVEYGPVQTEVLLAKGMALEDLGEYESSEATLMEALQRASQRQQWDAMREAATHLLYVAGDKLRRLGDAGGYRRVARGLSGSDPEAEALFLNNLAIVVRAEGKYAEAEAKHRAALALWEASLGPDHPTIAESRNNLATVLSDQGKYEDAEAELRAALASWQASLGPDHPKVAEARNNLATVLGDQDKDAEAEAEIRAARALWEASLGPDHPYVATSRNNLAKVLHAQGKYVEAEREHRAAQASWEASLGPDHPNVATSRNNLANVLRDQGKYAEATAEYRAALAVWKTVLGPDHFIVAATRRNLAQALLAQHNTAQALVVAEQAWARGQGDDVPLKWRAKIAFTLARILSPSEAGDRHRARQLAEDALASFEKAEHVSTEQVREVKQWLDEHPAVR